MIGIIGAMDSEVALLVEILDNAETKEICGCSFTHGSLHGHDVVISKCGVGKVNAAVCAQTMILIYSPELIINSGVAGSLSSEFHICDIAVGSDIVQHDFDSTEFGDPPGLYFPCDENAARVISEAANKLGIHAVLGRIASGDQFISDKSRKKHIVDTFMAKACEMESGAIAQVCKINGVRCAVIRAISDSTDNNHVMEFREFVHIAADTSAKVLITALDSGKL